MDIKKNIQQKGVKQTWTDGGQKQEEVGGWTNPSETYAQVKLDDFRNFGGEHKKYLRNHHPLIWRETYNPSYPKRHIIPVTHL